MAIRHWSAAQPAEFGDFPKNPSGVSENRLCFLKNYWTPFSHLKIVVFGIFGVPFFRHTYFEGTYLRADPAASSIVVKVAKNAASRQSGTAWYW